MNDFKTVADTIKYKITKKCDLSCMTWLTPHFIEPLECNMYSANICTVLYGGNKNSKMTWQVFFMHFGSSNYTKQILNKTDWREDMTTFLNKHSLEMP